jgi:hypothetical protein
MVFCFNGGCSNKGGLIEYNSDCVGVFLFFLGVSYSIE